MNRVAYALLWAFVFVTPWEQVVRIDGVGTISRLVGMGTLAVAVFTTFSNGRLRPPTLFHFWAAAFAIWGGVTVFWTLDTEGTILRFERNLQLLALLWLVWEVGGTPGRRAGLFQAYVLGAAVSAFNILVNYARGTPLVGRGDYDRYAASGFQPNDIAFLLVLSLPMAWHLSLTHHRAWLRWTDRAYLLVAVLAITLTGSRGGFLLCLVAALIVPWTLPQVRLGTKVAMLLVVLASGVITWRFITPRALARLETTGTEVTQGTMNARKVIWRAGLQLVPQHPLGGVGAGAFRKAVLPYLGTPKTAHNTYLAVLVEQGAIGLTLFSLMLLSVYHHVRVAPPRERRYLQILMLTLLVGLLPRTWEDEKHTWLVLALLLAPASVSVAVREVAEPSRRGIPIPARAGPEGRARAC